MSSRADYIQGLRQIAALLEAHEDVPTPAGSFTLVVDGAEALAAMRRTLGGTWTKNAYDDSFWITRQFASSLDWNIHAAREQVCERVVTGTEQVRVPDPTAPLVTVERETFEWVCSPLLDDAAVAS